jgi:hypothetical protein
MVTEIRSTSSGSGGYLAALDSAKVFPCWAEVVPVAERSSIATTADRRKNMGDPRREKPVGLVSGDDHSGKRKQRTLAVYCLGKKHS